MRKFDTTIEFDAAKFDWTPGGLGIGSAEASQLGLLPGWPPYCQVYQDAADLGMTLVNTKKGTKCDFVLTEEKFIDGDVISWTFESVNRPQGAEKILVTIYND
jgi:hypothetical protein